MMLRGKLAMGNNDVRQKLDALRGSSSGRPISESFKSIGRRIMGKDDDRNSTSERGVTMVKAPSFKRAPSIKNAVDHGATETKERVSNDIESNRSTDGFDEDDEDLQIETSQTTKLWLRFKKECYKFWITHNQRILRFSKVLWVFLYYAVGIAVFRSEQNWDLLTAIYFVTQTVATVGYGDLYPTTNVGRIFIIFYILTGILLVFTIVNEITYYIFIESLKKDTSKDNKGHKEKKQKKKARSKVAIAVRKSLEVILWFVLLFVLICLGGGIISSCEGWDFSYGFYFAAITSTAVGYGDRPVITSSGRCFNIFYILVSVSLTATAMEKASSLYSRIEAADYEQQLEEIPFSQTLLDEIKLYSGSDTVHKSDYILYMLVLSGKVDQERDVDAWASRFEEFDGDGNNTLDEKDLQLFKKVEAQRQIAEGRKVVRGQRQKSVIYEVLYELQMTFYDLLHLAKPKPKNQVAQIDDSLLDRHAIAHEIATMQPMPRLSTISTQAVVRRASALGSVAAGAGLVSKDANGNTIVVNWKDMQNQLNKELSQDTEERGALIECETHRPFSSTKAKLVSQSSDMDDVFASEPPKAATARRKGSITIGSNSMANPMLGSPSLIPVSKRGSASSIGSGSVTPDTSQKSTISSPMSSERSNITNVTNPLHSRPASGAITVSPSTNTTPAANSTVNVGARKMSINPLQNTRASVTGGPKAPLVYDGRRSSLGIPVVDMADRRSFADGRNSGATDAGGPKMSELDADDMSLDSVYGGPSLKFLDEPKLSDVSVESSSSSGRPRVESKGNALPEHLLNSVRRKEDPSATSTSQAGLVNSLLKHDANKKVLSTTHAAEHLARRNDHDAAYLSESDGDD